MWLMLFFNNRYVVADRLPLNVTQTSPSAAFFTEHHLIVFLTNT